MERAHRTSSFAIVHLAAAVCLKSVLEAWADPHYKLEPITHVFY
jgi:hypothetical protein